MPLLSYVQGEAGVAQAGGKARGRGAGTSAAPRFSSPSRGPRYGLAAAIFLHQITSMNFDDQIRRHFGIENLAAVPPEALNAGIEHMKVALGLAKDRRERFALWALLHALGSAPDLDVAFETEADREAARNFMDLIQGAGGE